MALKDKLKNATLILSKFALFKLIEKKLRSSISKKMGYQNGSKQINIPLDVLDKV